MKLRRLEIRRLPGISDGFALGELEPGLNVVLGPNASGKSSICRAVRALLYEEEVQGAVDLEARFENAHGSLEVVRQGREILWSRNGREIAKPLLPDVRLVSCFTMHLEDLISEGNTEKEIRERIGKILAGGYDLEALRQLDRFRIRPLQGQIEARALRDAERTLQETRGRQGALRSNEQRLDRLRMRKRQAGLETARIAPLETALVLLRHRQELNALDRELSEYPANMQRLVGDEATRLQDLSSTLETLRKRLAQTATEQESATEKLNRTDLEEEQPDEAKLAEQRQSLQSLRAVEQNRESAAEALAVARRALAMTIEELGGEHPTEETRIPPDAVRRAERGLSEKRGLDARRLAIEEQLALFDSPVADEEALERTQRAREALAKWLASPDWTEIPRRLIWPWILCVSAASLAGIAVAAWRVHWAFAFLALVVIVASIALLRRPAPPDHARAEAQAEFGVTGLAQPDEWTRERVLQRTKALESELVAGRQARNDAIRRKDLERARASLQTRLAEVEADLRDLARDVGFDPARLDGGFDRWLRLLEAYDGARHEVVRCAARLDHSAAKESSLRSALLEFLGRFKEAPEDTDADADRLETRLRHLEDRQREHQAARTTREKTQRESETIRGEIERTKEQIARVLETAGLVSRDLAELTRRLDLLDAWKQVTDRRRGKRAVVLETEQRLGEERELLELVDAGDENELRRRLVEAKELAGERERLSLEINEIETSVKQATAGTELETARTVVAQCKDRLRQRMEEEQYAAASGFLLGEVEQEHESVARPGVLRRAEQWFAGFTRDAYALTLSGSSMRSFRIRENSTGEDREPAQLSSGTRMQLFLALRLAFAEEAEKGREPLPIFLDEALTISDPERFRSVVECLHAVAQEQDRQIFYLTSQPPDVRALTDPSNGPRPILLHEVRGSAVSIADLTALELPRIEEIPRSAGRTPEEYAVALAVPPVALWDRPERVHLFHLLRDELALLERLLNRGVENVGQLRGLFESGRADLVLNDHEQENLRWRAALVDPLLEACRQGRGQPVDREALVASGISAKFVRQFSSLAEELHGDARGLIEAIEAKEDERVKRFRGDLREQLESYFEENGYFGTGATLGPREILLRVQFTAAADVERGTTTEEKVAEVTGFLLATAIPD